MSNSSHRGTGDTPQNQNNAMSNDPRDGQRNSFTAAPEPTPADEAPEKQGQEQLKEFGERGSKQD